MVDATAQLDPAIVVGCDLDRAATKDGIVVEGFENPRLEGFQRCFVGGVEVVTLVDGVFPVLVGCREACGRALELIDLELIEIARRPAPASPPTPGKVVAAEEVEQSAGFEHGGNRSRRERGSDQGKDASTSPPEQPTDAAPAADSLGHHHAYDYTGYHASHHQ
jgi:hypothetical protein